MKRFFSLLACVAVILSLSVPVFATGETDPETLLEPIPEETTPVDYDPPVVYVEKEEVTSFVDIILDDADHEWSAESIPAFMVEMFGEYTPRTQTVTEYHSDGTEITYSQIVPGLAGLDWTWLSSVGVFSMFMYCALRALGGCLKWI